MACYMVNVYRLLIRRDSVRSPGYVINFPIWCSIPDEGDIFPLVYSAKTGSVTQYPSRYVMGIRPCLSGTLNPWIVEIYIVAKLLGYKLKVKQYGVSQRSI
jgi:hypothetical protein